MPLHIYRTNMTRNHMVYSSNNVARYFETLNDIIMRFNQYYASFKWHSCKFWLLKYFWLLRVHMLCTKYGFQFLLASRIQNDPLEHHFWFVRQMSGSHYQISYSQILESEQGLQLSNILKLFDIKTKSDTIQKPTFMEYVFGYLF